MEANIHTVKDLSVGDAALELAMHPETIRRLLLAGMMPGYKAGRHWRLTRAALDEWKVAGGVRGPGRPRESEKQKSEKGSEAA